jgi:ribosomal protein S18 acetylase RimI-like enzyme
MSAAVALRPVAEDDAGFLFEIYVGTRDDAASVGWTAEERDSFLRMQFEAQSTDYQNRFPTSQHSIILVDGVACGRIWVDRGNDEIRLIDISLRPESRGRGTGRILLDRLIAESQEAGTPLRHSVYKANEAALRFYSRLGFEVIEELDLYVLMEWVGSQRGVTPRNE